MHQTIHPRHVAALRAPSSPDCRARAGCAQASRAKPMTTAASRRRRCARRMLPRCVGPRFSPRGNSPLARWRGREPWPSLALDVAQRVSIRYGTICGARYGRVRCFVTGGRGAGALSAGQLQLGGYGSADGIFAPAKCNGMLRRVFKGRLCFAEQAHHSFCVGAGAGKGAPGPVSNATSTQLPTTTSSRAGLLPSCAAMPQRAAQQPIAAGMPKHAVARSMHIYI
jgi:hypothetical protein